MHLTKQIHINQNHPSFSDLDELCFKCKNLYNQALWRIKNHYKTNKKILTYYDLDKQLKDENQVDYRSLSNSVAQQTLKILQQNINAYFATLRSFKKTPSKFKGCPKFPKFLDKDRGRMVAQFTILGVKKIPLVKENKLSLTNLNHEFDLGLINLEHKDIQQVRIVPRDQHFVIEIVHKVQSDNPIVSDNKCGIDLGLNNLATLGFNNTNCKPLIINGRDVKSINQYYNKKKSKIQSKLSKDKKRTSKRLKLLTIKRNNKIKDKLHKASKIITNYLVKNNISEVVIGQNKNWKSGINIGKRNSQNFVSVPHTRLIEMISYKCELKGIKVITREESYTSKCSFLDNESIRKLKNYKGKRIKRGLFQSAKGTSYNADLNGALNILRKELPSSFELSNGDGIEDLVVDPVKLNIPA